MNGVEVIPFRDRNPISGGLDLMPDLPIVLRHQTHFLNGLLGSPSRVRKSEPAIP